MAGSIYGKLFTISTWGESHGKALGVVVDGCPAGIPLCENDIQIYLNRRKPGQNQFSTQRNESDTVEILSGVFEGKTTGTPISMIVKNQDQHSKDYGDIAVSYRPGHADYCFDEKYGFRDYRGGGRSSGRETAARVAAGAVANEILKKSGIKITAYTIKAAGIEAKERDFSQIEKNLLRCPDATAAEKMLEKINEIKSKGDSAGGIIECQIQGVPAGLGEPVFDKLDAELAKAMLSIGAIKGIEFGEGFAAADLLGSENNDCMHEENGKIAFDSNHAGGILGGISNGQTIIFRVAVKPVTSIFIPQNTVCVQDGNVKSTELQIKGRHDVCLCPRIVPVVEAMAALVLADMII